MRHTKLHTNSVYVASLGLVLGTLLAILGQECFAGMVVTGALGLAINFADKPAD